MTQPTEKQFREEAIAEMIAQKKAEYREQRWSDYRRATWGRDDFKKKIKAATALPFTDEERGLFGRLNSLYRNSQHLVGELVTAENEISRTSSKADACARNLANSQENALRFSNRYLEALPEIMQLNILEEPTYDSYNQIFCFRGQGGSDKSLDDYAKIEDNEAQAKKFSMELDKWNEQLAQQQARRDSLLAQLENNMEQMRSIIATELPPIYEGLQARFAERKAAAEKELEDFEAKLNADFADLWQS